MSETMESIHIKRVVREAIETAQQRPERTPPAVAKWIREVMAIPQTCPFCGAGHSRGNGVREVLLCIDDHFHACSVRRKVMFSCYTASVLSAYSWGWRQSEACKAAIAEAKDRRIAELEAALAAKEAKP